MTEQTYKRLAPISLVCLKRPACPAAEGPLAHDGIASTSNLYDLLGPRTLQLGVHLGILELLGVRCHWLQL